MFRLDQIVSFASFKKELYSIANYITQSPQAILITRKDKQHLVLVNAEIFDELLRFKLNLVTPEQLCEEIRR